MYNIGDKVWVARFERVEEKVTCNCCFGSGYLTVIMGDKSEVTVECTNCQSGYDPPKGYNVIHNYAANSKMETITGIEISEGEIDYKTDGHYISDQGSIFLTKKEADEKADELGRIFYANQLKQLQSRKENDKRSWAWNATYHRGRIKRAKEDIEYHTAKLEVAAAKGRDK